MRKGIQIVVQYKGQTYYGAVDYDTKMTAREAADAWFQHMDNLAKFRMGLEDGSFLVLGESAIQEMAMTIREV